MDTGLVVVFTVWAGCLDGFPVRLYISERRWLAPLGIIDLFSVLPCVILRAHDMLPHRHDIGDTSSNAQQRFKFNSVWTFPSTTRSYPRSPLHLPLPRPPLILYTNLFDGSLRRSFLGRLTATLSILVPGASSIVLQFCVDCTRMTKDKVSCCFGIFC
ncbi:hypothetical protein DFP72DRAFT_913610 [Ephemerocybe angulata]|uniref:Uncharacterized protein n=1 Tax=Ephemerocybe angulata TaxID=980116 RepID=A0A8H6LYX3_9AGAR|nr:hypothetical protein DFP72DRAFT_913610 [Tulosesus angulatus]